MCEARIDALYDASGKTGAEGEDRLRLRGVFQATWQDRSFKTFGMGMLTWMQVNSNYSPTRITSLDYERLPTYFPLTAWPRRYL
jgi:hypothetical protein